MNYDYWCKIGKVGATTKDKPKLEDSYTFRAASAIKVRCQSYNTTEWKWC